MPSRALAALFLSAAAGLVIVVGLALSAFGTVAVVLWAVLVALVLALGVRKARALRPPPSTSTGRTCSCCTTTVHDPVKVI